ncbi:MAG: endolytic transglycosylase MltG [Hyphomicrobiales bacterium]|nr:MAG: endolytic transglycosylase MltG [Hyphomicrobiales bacterium]
MARKKRKSSALALLNGLLTLIVIGIIAAGGIAYWGMTQYYAEGPRDTEAAFLIPKGATLRGLVTPLEEQGFIDNALVMQAAIRLGSTEANLLPGQYVIPAKASMADILEIITTTKPQEFFLNVIPGETSWQVVQRLNDPAQSLAGETVEVPAEGTLLAERHDFFPGDTRATLLESMQQKMKDEIARVWAARDPAINDVIKTPEEMVIMASLVEKETGVETERPLVAAVFINRLKKSMRLQTDPTVIYGITNGQGPLGRGLTRSELNAKTPYNTYQIDGLPPTPIANPGTAALEAVAHPAETNYLYFVAKGTNPSDGHLFAATYAEHRKNVALYRKAEDEAAREELEAQEASEAGDTTQ